MRRVTGPYMRTMVRLALLLRAVASAHKAMMVPTEKQRREYRLTVAGARKGRNSESSTARTLYFFAHVPKTGGVSLVDDLVDFFGLRSCTGRRTVALKLANGTSTDWPTAMRAGVCDMANTEGHYAGYISKFPRPPRLLLLIRDPITHVVSMFSHCQYIETSFRKWNHTTGTLAQWLQTAPNPALCHFDPRDMQTSKLCEHDWQRCRTLVEREAYFVARLEHYDRALCALFFKMFQTTMPVYCAGIEPLLSFRHVTHNTHPPSGALELDDDLTRRIRALTPLDHDLAALSHARFHAELKDLAAAASFSSTLTRHHPDTLKKKKRVPPPPHVS